MEHDEIDGFITRAVGELPQRQHAGEKHTPREWARALVFTRGIIGAACRKLEVSRGTGTDALARYPQLRTLCDAIIEENLDLAESGLSRALGDEKPWAIKAYLGYHGHRRGLVTRSKVDLDPPPVPDLSKYPTERIAKALKVLRGEE